MKVKKADARNTLFIEYLPKNVVDYELEDAINQLAKKTATHFSFASDNHRSSRVAWVTYKSHEDAIAALKGLHNQRIGDSELKVSVEDGKREGRSE